jgi:arylsulfatase A-like enzyme
VPTLAEQFTAAGYRTVSISENGLISTALGSTRGFEVSIERPSDSTNTLWSIDQASQVVQKDDERPLFLFVNLLDAHTPWYLSPLPWLDVHRPLLEPGASPDWLEPFVTHLPSGGVKVDLSAHHPPSNLTGEEAFNKGVWQPPPEAWTLFRDMYDASVYRSDYKLHKLMNTWIGHRSGTVAVTSDHGELLGEHDAVFHARSVWPELTQVPLVIVSPDRIPAGGVVDAPVQMTDLHDTLLHIAGISEGPRSLLPAASGSGPVPAGPIQAAAWPDAGFGNIVGGMFQHEWRLHREGDRAVVVGSDGSASLYNLADDPGMQTDLLAVDPDAHRAEAEPLIQAARSWTVKASEQLPAPSSDTMDALEALGYIDPGTPAAPPETP